MKLFYSPGACSMAAHILLQETDATYTIEKVDLRAKTTETGRNFLDVNPRGAVPALELEDGTVITQNSAILQFLGDSSAVEAFKPAYGSIERARLQEALGIASDLHSALGVFFAPGIDDAARERALVGANRRLGQVEAMAPAEGFFLGAFSQADAYLFAVLSWTKPLQIDISGYPKVSALFARIAARPSVQTMLKEEGLAA